MTLPYLTDLFKVWIHDTPLLTDPLALVRSSGRAAAPGLTPLRLPRAPMCVMCHLGLKTAAARLL